MTKIVPKIRNALMESVSVKKERSAHQLPTLPDVINVHQNRSVWMRHVCAKMVVMGQTAPAQGKTFQTNLKKLCIFFRSRIPVFT